MKQFNLTNDSFESTFNDLNLFEQTNYCYNYIKTKFPKESDEKINNHAIIVSACFRQANEFYVTAKKSSINTNPLLYSYALNNLLKGTCYLKSMDDEILNQFSQHGFSIDNKKIKNNILEQKIKIKKHGALIAILKLYNYDNSFDEVDFDFLLRHIPGIESIYYKTTNNTSLLAKKDKSGNYFCIGATIDEKMNNILKESGIRCVHYSNTEKIHVSISYKFLENIKDDLFKHDNIYYKNYFVFPNLINKKLVDLNVIFYCYLLIMSYGMLVRYNAQDWEKFADKKTSKEAILIELSIDKSVQCFYYQIHYLLNDFYYEEENYYDSNVKRVIDESTKRIMNNIYEEIENHNFSTNSKDQLPWKKF